MMPKDIRREHMIKTLEEIGGLEMGFHTQNESIVYCLQYDINSARPNYIISLANEYVNDINFYYSRFNGGSNKINKFFDSSISLYLEEKSK
jgi:hypothetical protein